MSVWQTDGGYFRFATRKQGQCVAPGVKLQSFYIFQEISLEQLILFHNHPLVSHIHSNCHTWWEPAKGRDGVYISRLSSSKHLKICRTILKKNKPGRLANPGCSRMRRQFVRAECIMDGKYWILFSTVWHLFLWSSPLWCSHLPHLHIIVSYCCLDSVCWPQAFLHFLAVSMSLIPLKFIFYISRHQ